MLGELSGATVRDADGTIGRIVSWAMPRASIAWDEGAVLPREESFVQANPRLQNQIEVMTLNAGWRPLKEFMTSDGVPQGLPAQIDSLRALLSEADQLFEKGKKHWPYKNKSSLGPGPRGGTNSQTDKWDCKCANYRCQCTGPDGQKKTVKIDKGYKAAYNAEYKKWRASKK